MARQRQFWTVPLIFLLLLAPGRSFVIPGHKEITSTALKRFGGMAEWEREQILRGSTDADLNEGGLPLTGGPYEKLFHFDNCMDYNGVVENYRALSDLVDRNMAKKRHDPYELGKILHAIEDFYSHSNYIVLYREAMRKERRMVGSIPLFEEVVVDSAEYKNFLNLLRSRLRTGRYPDHAKVADDDDHGSVLWPGKGLNKDTMLRDLYVDARQTALEAAAWYLNLYNREPSTLAVWKRWKATKFGADVR